MPARSTFSLDDLFSSIAEKFNEAQSSLANHRKNCVALHKLHLQASKVKTSGHRNDHEEGEEAFGDVFLDMVNRSLAVKKGVFADRIVKFVASYVKLMNSKVMEDPSQQNEEETFASRFITRLLDWLFQGFKAKNKIVRQRSIQLVAEMMANIGEIDEPTYNKLRDNLIERLCDKEPVIRAHSVIALSKLVGTEDPDELGHGEKTCLDLLLECVQYDSSAEVRRAALANLPVTPETLPFIITRTRDTDTLTRKLAYSAVLEPRLSHPRHLTIAQREEITKVGLGDREPVVRVAAGKMITRWLDIAMSEPDPPGQPPLKWTGDDGGVMKGFVNFLAFFDVVGPGEVIAVDAILSVFATRPALLDDFVFSDDYWEDLTPESAVLARVFVDQCVESSKGENRLEAASIPVVTAFAFHIQQSYNGLVSLMQEMDFMNIGEPDDEESEAREEELAKRELILSELLRIALKLDYMDEIGRRKVFTVVRDMLAHPHLPPGLIEHCLDVLCEILPSERELIRIVVEIIIELRDDDTPIDDNFDGSRSDITQSTIAKERSMRRAKERDEMSPEEQQEVDLTDMRCLVLCIGMLERVNGTFEDHSTLEGVLTDLIVPAVKRKELALREKGLVALGLCCLIARNMATNSFQLFLNQVQTAPEDLKLKVIQIVFDLLILYDQEFLGRSEEISHQIVSFILQTLDSEESSVIQSVLCIGICKLLLSGQVTDSRVLLSLVLTYISPSTMDNAELKQCLSYFFPVYCYSSRGNQSRIRSIFINAFELAKRLYEQAEDDQKEDSGMISLHQFGLLMIDWTDVTKLVDKVPPPKPNDRHPHADLALDILLALYDSDRDDEARKILCQFLGQLQLFSSKEAGLELDDRIILKLNILVENLQEQCPFDDASLDRTFNRVKDRFRTAFSKHVERIDPGQYVDEEFVKFYEVIGMEVPEATVDEEPSRVSGAAAPPIEEEEEEEEEEIANGEAEGQKESAADNEETEDAAGDEVEDVEEEQGEQEAEVEEEPVIRNSKVKSKGKVTSRSKSKSKFRSTRKAKPSSNDEIDVENPEEEKEASSSRTSQNGRASKTKTASTSRTRSKRRSDPGEDVFTAEEEKSQAAVSSAVTTSPMKKAGKRTRASQGESEPVPSNEPVSPVRKKRVGTSGRSSRMEDEQVSETNRDPSPSPKPKSRPKSKPKVTPKRGRGSRAVASTWSGGASEEQHEDGERAGPDEEVLEMEQEEKHEQEEAHRELSPSPKPRGRTTRNSGSGIRSTRTSRGTTKTEKEKLSRPSKENTSTNMKARGKSKGRTSAESAKPKAVPKRASRRRQEEEEEEEIEGFDSDI